MADFEDIQRPLTSDEKQQVNEVGRGSTLLDEFMKKLSAYRIKFLKEYKPFDVYSARVDFEDSIKQHTEYLTTIIDKKSIKGLNNFDLDKYGEPSRFELIEVADVVEERIAGNMNTRVPVVTGKRYTYKAKVRGNGFAIFVPTSECERVDIYVNKTYRSSEKEESKKEKK